MTNRENWAPPLVFGMWNWIPATIGFPGIPSILLVHYLLFLSITQFILRSTNNKQYPYPYPETKLLQSAGLDAVLYLRSLKWAMILLMILSVISLVLIVPINYLAGEVIFGYQSIQYY